MGFICKVFLLDSTIKTPSNVNYRTNLFEYISTLHSISKRLEILVILFSLELNLSQNGCDVNPEPDSQDVGLSLTWVIDTNRSPWLETVALIKFQLIILPPQSSPQHDTAAIVSPECFQVFSPIFHTSYLLCSLYQAMNRTSYHLNTTVSRFLSCGSLQLLQNYLQLSGLFTSGNCSSDYFSFSSLQFYPLFWKKKEQGFNVEALAILSKH